MPEAKTKPTAVSVADRAAALVGGWGHIEHLGGSPRRV